MNELTALKLLSECTGDDIWSLQHCRERRVPQDWLDELADCFESNPQIDSETIYYRESATNQFEGIRDVDLARRIATFLRIELADLEQRALNRQHLVRLIQESAEEA